jgi:hypothetical protein
VLGENRRHERIHRRGAPSRHSRYTPGRFQHIRDALRLPLLLGYMAPAPLLRVTGGQTNGHSDLAVWARRGSNRRSC